MNTAAQIITALGNPTIGFTDLEIKQAWALLKMRHSQNAALSAQAFQAGDRVSFVGKGQAFEGVVVKVNQKSISVRTDRGNWKVAPSLLKKAA